jgi:radical SAM superfamily enzyme YgiQ (UPF0313 family)
MSDESRRHRPHTGSLSLALVYPAPAREGASSLALYRLDELARRAGISCCEMFFVEEDQAPRSCRSGRRLSDFDLIACSVSAEEQWPVVPWMLQGSGIETRAEKRSYPLLLLGGFSLRLNPLPLSPLADAIVQGDAEPVFEELLLAAARGGDVEQIRQRFSRLDGVWVPLLQPQPPAPLFYVGGEPALQTKTANQGVFSRMLLVETGRGCPVRCRFCAVGHSRPAHFFPARRVLSRLEQQDAENLAIGLVGASFCWHPQLEELLRLVGHADLGLASLDARRLSSPAGQPVLEAIARCRLRTATLAPEAGSEKLRRAIGKPLSDLQLQGAIERLLASGVFNIKLYFMYGLPDEKLEDLEAIVELSSRIREQMTRSQARAGKTGRLSLSVNPWVPKPTTPWDGLPMCPMNELKEKWRFLQKKVNAVGGVDLQGTSPRSARLQYLLDHAGADAFLWLEKCSGRFPPSASLVRELEEMVAGSRKIS